MRYINPQDASCGGFIPVPPANSASCPPACPPRPARRAHSPAAAVAVAAVRAPPAPRVPPAYGSTGEGLNTVDPFVPGESYPMGALVFYQGALYRSQYQ